MGEVDLAASVTTESEEGRCPAQLSDESDAGRCRGCLCPKDGFELVLEDWLFRRRRASSNDPLSTMILGDLSTCTRKSSPL
jgi:hypothetical protein